MKTYHKVMWYAIMTEGDESEVYVSETRGDARDWITDNFYNSEYQVLVHEKDYWSGTVYGEIFIAFMFPYQVEVPIIEGVNEPPKPKEKTDEN